MRRGRAQGEATQRWRQTLEGCSHTPRTARSPQKLEDAAKILPQNFGRKPCPHLGFGLLASGAAGEDTPEVSGRPVEVMCPSGSFGKGHCTGDTLSRPATSGVGPSCSLTPLAASLPVCVVASGEIPGSPGRPGDWVWKAQKLKSPLAPASGGPRGPRLSWAASFDLLSQGEAISAKVRKCGLRSAVRAGRKWGNAQKCLRSGRPCPFALKPQLCFFQQSEQP